MATGNTLQMSIKILLISTGLILLAILFSSADIPAIYSAFKSWLRPPYLYFIINGIIITIVASSRLHHNHHASPSPLEGDIHVPPLQLERETHAPEQQQNKVSMFVKDVDVEEIKEVMVACEVRKPLEYEIVQESKAMEYEFEEESVGLVAEAEVEAEAVEVDRFSWGSKPPVPLARQEALVDLLSQRPPAVSRFGHNRRPAKGGKVLRKVAKPKKQDTLESTWKAITEGRHIPLTRHLKKSDTWENNNNNNDHQIDLLNDLPPIQEVKKSQTFTDRTNYTSPRVTPSITKLKKEPSLGQDELNRRVEAFINKFNEDMRLQRQQSMQQFMEMINRAA
ncbi:uncharacterized protein LOC141596043 isoform X2 [Silene latifolia]|uniref:uncharacterized protein LOC141596043 isoform X2 n=1 Tax=Silene latifolia TaxID=37657 RepID=UPI003D76FFCE